MFSVLLGIHIDCNHILHSHSLYSLQGNVLGVDMIGLGGWHCITLSRYLVVSETWCGVREGSILPHSTVKVINWQDLPTQKKSKSVCDNLIVAQYRTGQWAVLWQNVNRNVINPQHSVKGVKGYNRHSLLINQSFRWRRCQCWWPPPPCCCCCCPACWPGPGPPPASSGELQQATELQVRPPCSISRLLLSWLV